MSQTLQDEYWDQSLRPLNCLAFIVPLLALYEVGVVCLGSVALRNGADVWLRAQLSQWGFGDYYCLPLITCGVLLIWHHLSREQWKLRVEVLSGMICESFVFAVMFIVTAQLCGSLFQTPTAVNALLLDKFGEVGSDVPKLLSYLGAGIYEEFLFRLLLLSGTIAVCRKIGAGPLSSATIGVIATSLLFAAAHYALFFHQGFEFTWYSFLFRTVAGAMFSLLFLKRGFGIVVGTHCMYDIIVASVLS